MFLGAGLFRWATQVGGWKRACNRIRQTELVAGRARVCRTKKGWCKEGGGGGGYSTRRGVLKGNCICAVHTWRVL